MLASSGLGVQQTFAVSVLDRHESELVQAAMEAVAASSPADAVILQGLIAELRAKIESGQYNPSAEDIVDGMVRRSIADRIR